MNAKEIKADMRAFVRAELAEFRQDNLDFIDEGQHLVQLIDAGCARVDRYLAAGTRKREAA